LLFKVSCGLAMSLVAPLFLDKLNRVALVAIELIDPVTLLLVSEGIEIKAEGLTAKPIINLSGRFVWFVEGDHWPIQFSINPGHLPYESDVVLAPAKPPKPGEPKPDEIRLLRITLRPTSVYPFSDGITVVRGQLRRTEDREPEAISGAEVWIRWLNFPIGGNSEEWVNASTKARTNKFGEFLALLRLPNNARPYEKEGSRMKNTKLKIRIAVSLDALVCEMADPQTTWKIYELPEGRPYDLPTVLAWSALTPVNDP
jgi:hypothetical protein